MSDRLPAVTPKQLIRVLEAKGWQLHRIRGSHHLMFHPERRQVVPVPVHHRELKTGTLIGILRSTGITRDELREMLNKR